MKIRNVVFATNWSKISLSTKTTNTEIKNKLKLNFKNQ